MHCRIVAPGAHCTGKQRIIWCHCGMRARPRASHCRFVSFNILSCGPIIRIIKLSIIIIKIIIRTTKKSVCHKKCPLSLRTQCTYSDLKLITEYKKRDVYKSEAHTIFHEKTLDLVIRHMFVLGEIWKFEIFLGVSIHINVILTIFSLTIARCP